MIRFAAGRSGLLTVFACLMALAQQVAFTSRTYVDSPVLMTSIKDSREYGFESAILRNDGPSAITAIHFRILLRNGENDEVADERRIAVSLERGNARRVEIGLGHLKALQQLARERHIPDGLAILTVESVEYDDGTEWRETERKGDIPFQPAVPRK